MAAGFDEDRCFMVAEIAGDELYFQTISRAGVMVDSGVIRRVAKKTGVVSWSTVRPGHDGLSSPLSIILPPQQTTMLPSSHGLASS